MGIHTIENDRIKLGIDLLGGSIVSFYDKKRGEELFWQGDPQYWPKRDVVIFPIVGVRDNGFDVDGKNYNIGMIHGLARTQEFTVVISKSDSVLMEITSNEETLKEYPFNYKLGVKYELSNAGFKLTYIVTSLDGVKMPFYVGGHAGLNLPGGEGKVVFENKSNLSHFVQENGYASEKPELLWENATEITLDKNTYAHQVINGKEVDFTNGCMLERDFEGGVTLVRKDGLAFKYDISDSTLLTLWGFQNGGEYFCVEPWWGTKQTTGREGNIFNFPKINVAEKTPKEYYFAIDIID